MSDRKRERLRVCMMCGRKANIQQHGKCHECRVQLQMGRYIRDGKLNKFTRRKKSF